jgi:N-acetyl-gamma-glutamyl-phosphate reductase
MVKVGIVGGTGYTGSELLRLLAQHPSAKVVALTSRKEAGIRADQFFPALRGHCEVVFSAPDLESLSECQAVFFATPHATAMNLAPDLLAQGVKVIDLSADFRLQDPATFEKWYAHAHSCPELLPEAVYGLPELFRARLRKAKLVAAPGCYPTATQLGFLPLLEQHLVQPDSLIADCKSGVSGAGREAKVGSLFCETADTLKAYAVAGHRHLPEIRQNLDAIWGAPVQLTFVPHLVPMIRGMHCTLYARLRPEHRHHSTASLQQLYQQRYANEPFVDVLPAGEHPETRSVRGSNVCRISVFRAPDSDQVVICSVIDNLMKGAAAQAVQCFNLALGLEETLGLRALALSP